MFARSHQDIARTDSGFETCLGSFNQVAIAPQWRLTRKIRLQFRNGKLGDNASFAKKQVTACSASTLVDAILPYHCATPQSIGQRHPACQSRLIQSTTSNAILAAPPCSPSRRVHGSYLGASARRDLQSTASQPPVRQCRLSATI